MEAANKGEIVRDKKITCVDEKQKANAEEGDDVKTLNNLILTKVFLCLSVTP